jgi:hypothetical protein
MSWSAASEILLTVIVAPLIDPAFWHAVQLVFKELPRGVAFPSKSNNPKSS